MKLSFFTLGCPEWTIEQIASNAKLCGYEGVELRVADDGNHLLPNASAAEAKRVAAVFRDAGVAIASFGAYPRFAILDPAEVARNADTLRRIIGMAGDIGVPFIRAYAGQLPKGSEFDEIVKKVSDSFRPMAAEAAERGVRIGLETHDDWCAGDRLMKIISAVGSKSLGVVYDILNTFTAGLEPWEESYRKMKGSILYCHMKDGYTGPDGKLHYCMLGAGDLPVNAILSRFKADGFDGYFSFEWEKKWHPELEPPERVFPHYAHKMRALWKTV